ncbi:MAG: hypothetical protein HOV96_25850 [Nonomuraea sp.]|nr:hypothetical protein [Nonomuraea sp.]NUS05260.1 hypothetical protein [Nonomuraea sp.]
MTVRTRRGGTHLYFPPPEGLRLGHKGGLGWLIDTRACGDHVVGPGLAHDWSTASELQQERAGLRETGGPPVRTLFALVSGLIR